jgi:group I intron endonuclease
MPKIREGIIYKVTNKINGKAYIGQTINYDNRKWGHINSSVKTKNSDYNSIFHRAIRKYGIESFEWNILYKGSYNPKLLDELEMVFINYYGTFGKGYNANIGGGSNTGIKRSEETKKKLSDINKGKKISKEIIEKIRLKNIGKKRDDNFRLQLSLRKKGTVVSIETRQKQSNSAKNRPKISKETSIKLSMSRTGLKSVKADKTMYKFYHAKYGLEICTRTDMKIKYNLKSVGIHRLVKNERKQYKGWIILKDNQ